MNSGNVDPKERHERRDVNGLALAVIAAGIMVLGVVGYFGLHAFLNALSAVHNREEAPPHPMATREAQTLPDPGLQVEVSGGLERVRAKEAANLNGYAWIDRKAGRVRIPIERAMSLIVQRQTDAKEKP